MQIFFCGRFSFPPLPGIHDHGLTPQDILRAKMPRGKGKNRLGVGFSFQPIPDTTCRARDSPTQISGEVVFLPLFRPAVYPFLVYFVSLEVDQQRAQGGQG